MKTVLILLLLAVAAFFGGRALLPELTPEVLVAEVTRETAQNLVSGNVEVFANIDIQIKTDMAGFVTEFPVKIGQDVAVGEVIARLESKDIALNLEQRRIQLDAARKRLDLPYAQELDLENVKEDLERLRQLVDGGAASPAELEKRRRDLERTQGYLDLEFINRHERVAVLEAEVEQLENRLERMVIRAPFAGQIVEQLAFKGDYVWGNGSLARLVSPGRYLILTLAEEDFYGVEKGQEAIVRLAGLGGRRIPAKVSALSSVADGERKTRDVFLATDLPDSELTPGFTGEAALIKATREGSLVVPRRALLGDRLFRIDAEGRVDILRVQPGFVGLNKAEILEGVSEGDLVVLERQSLLRQGERVRVNFVGEL
jgi:RND family efflux transporter MFP subunit